MSQSLSQLYTHIIYSTKHRETFLADKPFAQEVHAYLSGICRNLNSPSILVGGAADHIHILCNLARDITIQDFLRELKRESTKWIKRTKTESLYLSKFSWQAGYGAFSISPSHVGPLKRYILNQEEHHKRENFQDELRRFLRKYGVQYDERYIWD